MRTEKFKALTLLGGLATLALGSTFMLRASGAKPRPALGPCAPRLLELERAVCEPLPPEPRPELASLAAP
jgi:hypothetical protein